LEEREKQRLEMQARATRALGHECPDCGGLIQVISAREMHPAHVDGEVARRCLLCHFVCFIGDDPLHHQPEPDPEPEQERFEPCTMVAPESDEDDERKEDIAAFEAEVWKLYELERAYWEGQMAAWEWRMNEVKMGDGDGWPLIPPLPPFPPLPLFPITLPCLPTLPPLLGSCEKVKVL